MNAEQELQKLLKAHAVMVRNHVHTVWRLPGGQIMPISKTPSDSRAAKNALSVLRRLLREAAELRVEPQVEGMVTTWCPHCMCEAAFYDHVPEVYECKRCGNAVFS